MIEMTVDHDRTVVYARPPHGRPIAFMVEARGVKLSRSPYDNRRPTRFVVTLQGNRSAELSRHTTEEAAQRACLKRAQKYDRAYSEPRGLGVAS